MNEIVEAPAPAQETAEAWRPVIGYEGLYEVSSHGCIRSLPRQIARRHTKPYMAAARERKPAKAIKSGYWSLTLADGSGNEKTHYVHALVLGAFVGPRPPKYDACHNDGDRSNNHASNLRWDTRAANHADKKVHGTGNAGDQHPLAKLTSAQVLQMRKMRASGVPVRDLSATFNVSERAAYRATTGENWSHL